MSDPKNLGPKIVLYMENNVGPRKMLVPKNIGFPNFICYKVIVWTYKKMLSQKIVKKKVWVPKKCLTPKKPGLNVGPKKCGSKQMWVTKKVESGSQKNPFQSQKSLCPKQMGIL